MKSKKIIKVVNFVLVGMFLLFLILGVALPLISVSSTSSSAVSKIYFFDLFGNVSISSGSSVSTQPEFFFGVVTLATSIVGAIFACFDDNKVLKTIGISLLASDFVFFIYIFSNVQQSIEVLRSSSSSLKFNNGGSVLLLLAGIFALLICLLAVTELVLPLLTKFIKPKQSLEEKLLELSSLKEKGLISEEEYESLRKEAIK